MSITTLFNDYAKLSETARNELVDALVISAETMGKDTPPVVVVTLAKYAPEKAEELAKALQTESDISNHEPNELVEELELKISNRDSAIDELTKALQTVGECIGGAMFPATHVWYRPLKMYAPARAARFFTGSVNENEALHGYLNAQAMTRMIPKTQYDRAVEQLTGSAKDLASRIRPASEALPYEFMIVDEELNISIIEDAMTNSTGMNAILEKFCNMNQTARGIFMKRLNEGGFSEQLTMADRFVRYSISARKTN